MRKTITRMMSAVLALAILATTFSVPGFAGPQSIAGGEYTIPVSLWNATSNQPSMGNNAIEQSAKLFVDNGVATLHLNFKPLEFMGMTGYLSQIDLLDNIVFNANNYPTGYDLIPAAVLSEYDVVDDFNKPDGTDPKVAGKKYPKEVTVPVTPNQEYTWVHVYVPIMGSMGFGDQVARIKLDWNNLTATGGGNSDEKFTVPVKALNLTDSNPSMVDSYLVKQAAVSIDGDTITAAVKVTGDGTRKGDAVFENIWIEPAAKPAPDAGGYVTGAYNEADDTMTFLLELSTLDLPVIYAYFIPLSAMPSMAVQGMRLDFDLDNKEPFEAPNKSALAEAISTADALVEADYLAESWAVLTVAADYANFVMDSAAATQQEVDGAAANLGAAIGALVPYSARAELEALIEACAAYVETDYTQASWNVFREKLDAAKLAADNEESSSEAIAAALSELQAAVAALVPSTGGEVFTATTYEELDFYIKNAKDADTVKFGANIAAPEGTMSFPTISKKITIDGDGYIYDGQNYDRLNMFRVTANDFTLKNLIIKNAQFPASPAAGRAIHFRGSGVLAIDNCVFTGIKGMGGIIEINYQGEIRLTNSTFIGNEGGNVTAGNKLTGYVANTIMAGNNNLQHKDINKNSSLVDGGNNLISSVAVDNFKAEGTLTGEALGDITSWINGDGTLKNNPESPAINKVPSNNPYFTAKDIRGVPRTQYGLGDIGAYELTEEIAGGPIADGKYMADVTALQLLSDSASMMDAFMADQATLSVDGGRITAALKTVGNDTMKGNEILSKIWVEPIAKPEMDTGGYITGVYNEADDTMTFVLELSTLELPVIYAHIIPMGQMGAAIQGVRLDFDTNNLTPFSAPDKSALTAAILGIDSLNEQDYLAESWAALARVADYARFVRDSVVVTQEEVDAETGKVNAAIAVLIPYSARAELEALIGACDAYIETEYTQASWNAFKGKLEAAKLVAEDETSSPEAIATALSELQAAVAALVPSTGGEVFTATTYEELDLYIKNAKDGDTVKFGADIAAPEGTMTFPNVTKKITVDGDGHIYDGQNYDRLNMLRVTASDFTLKNLIIKNAQFPASPAAGRAIHFRGSGALTIDNCVFTGIKGVFGIIEINYQGELRLTNSTFIGNEGGIVTAGNKLTGYVANTVMAGNSNLQYKDINKNSLLTDGGNNLIGSVAVDNFDGGGTLIGEALGDITSWINGDGTPKNNPASPAINKVSGDNPYFTAKDIKGVSRTQYGLGDIGAYELEEDVIEPSGYVPGIYKGVGQGYAGNGDPDIAVFVQVTTDEIVKIWAGTHNQTATFFNMAFNGAYGSNSIPKQVIEKQGTGGVDAVSGATLSSNGIKEAIEEALANAKAGNAALPDEVQTFPAAMWQANADQPSMMNGMLVPTAEVRRYGGEYTAVIQIGPTTIYGISVSGSDAQNIRTASKTGEFTVAPVTERYEEHSKVKTLEVWLNAMKEPLPMKIYVVPMQSDQTVRLKLTFGVEKDKLEVTIAAAEVKYANSDIYTSESFVPFETALNSAKAVFADENATQEQVDTANTALVNADKALVIKPRDRTAYTLEELIDYAANAVNGDVIRMGADMSANADAEQSASKRLIETKVDLTIEGQGHKLDGQHKFGFFYVRGGTLTINNIIIENAEVNPTGSSPQAGPAIYVPSTGGNTGNLKLADSIVTGGLALNGGIYVAARNIEMTNCALIGSSARTGSNIYIDKAATGVLKNNIIIGSVPVLETTNSDVNFGAAGGSVVLGENNIIGLIYSGYLPANVDGTSVILGDFKEEDYTPESWAAFKNAWEQASVISDSWDVIRANTDALRAAISALEEAEKEPLLADGEYAVPVRLWHSVNDQASMGDAALEQTAKLVAAGGEATLHLNFKPLAFMGTTGYLSQLDLLDNAVLNENNYPTGYDLVPATVLATYDVVDDFNKPGGTDPKVAGKPYPKEVTVPVTINQEYTWVHVYVPVMGSMGFGDQVARIKLDWSGLTGVTEEPDFDAEPGKTIEAQEDTVQLTKDEIAGLASKNTIALSFGGATIVVPVSLIAERLNGEGIASLKMNKQDAASGDKTAIDNKLASRENRMEAFDISFVAVSGNGGEENISDLGGRIKVVINLTPSQATTLDNAESRKVCYYNPETGNLEDIDAVFDLTAGTVTFFTDHLSTYTVIYKTTSGGGSGGTSSNPDGISNGTYTIGIRAVQEYSDSVSMADQFIQGPATLKVSGSTMTATMVWHGTQTSPQSPAGIHMRLVKELKYKNASGVFVNASKALNDAQNTLTITFSVRSVAQPVYFQVYVPEGMGETRQVFRLVFDRNTLQRTASSSSGTSSTYTITASAGEGGTIDPGGAVSVNAGADQSFAITPDEGYVISDVLVDGKSQGAVAFYTFSKVNAAATISAVFEKEQKANTQTPGVSGFTDIDGHWAKDYIAYVVENKIFNGTGETSFSPDLSMTRGMLATVLGRLFGMDTAGYAQSAFEDVPAETYYSPYIAWASEQNIVKGTGGGLFEPDRNVTREEAAVIFTNYIKLTGADIKTGSEGADATLEDGRYTVSASALQENSEKESMADQFLTAPATLEVTGGEIKVSMVWSGTEFITMDMLEELKIEGPDGQFTEVERSFDRENNTLTISFEVEDLNKPVVMQVYVPGGMGEMRPKFRLVLDLDTLQKTTDDGGFADADSISDWAKDAVDLMKALGIVKGKEDNRFEPQGTATRAEVAAMIFNAKDLLLSVTQNQE